MSRVVIAGGPRTGKTTLAAKLGNARSTDDVMHLGWSEASQEVSTWLGQPGTWTIEGVATPRALREWLASNPDGTPCDEVRYLTETHTPVTGGQAAMAKGCETVWLEIEPELQRRGVRITYGGAS